MVITNPEEISKVLKDKRFISPSYIQPSFTSLEAELSSINEIIQATPLPFEDDLHKNIRGRYVEAISQKNKHIIQSTLDSGLHRFEKNSFKNNQADLINDWLKPLVSLVMKLLVDDRRLEDICNNLWDFPLLFNDRVSPMIRKKMGRVVLSHLENSGLENSPYFREKIGLFIIGSSSLLSTLANSTITALESSELRIGNNEIPSTGVKLIERISTCETTINGESVQPMDRIKLIMSGFEKPTFLEAGNDTNFFGVGRHICPGMKLSKDLWGMCIPSINKLKEKRTEITNIEYRKNDATFSLPNLIEVSF